MPLQPLLRPTRHTRPLPPFSPSPPVPAIADREEEHWQGVQRVGGRLKQQTAGSQTVSSVGGPHSQ